MIYYTEQEKKTALEMFLSGQYMVKEICARLGISAKTLKKIVEDAGYGY